MFSLPPSVRIFLAPGPADLRKRFNGFDPEAYLTDVITRLPDHPASRVHELLPHVWKAARAAAAGDDV